MFLLFACWSFLLLTAKGISSSPDGGASSRHWPGRDVQVLFKNGQDGIRSQSISYSGRPEHRYPRQLALVHDDEDDGESSSSSRGHFSDPPSFDSGYDRFINEHFRQKNYAENYRPESESEQMARDHERFGQLAHYHPWKSHPALEGREGLKTQQRRGRIQPFWSSSIQADVEYHQPSDETIETSRNGYDTNVKEYQEVSGQVKEQEQEPEQRNPRHCKALEKDDMLCQVCLNPRTGDKSESCSYASKPQSRKYAYAKGSSFSRRRNNGDEEGDNRDEDEDDSEEDDENINNNNSEDHEDEEEIQPGLPLRKRNQLKMVRSGGGPRIKREEGGAQEMMKGKWIRRMKKKARRNNNGSQSGGGSEAETEKRHTYTGGEPKGEQDISTVDFGNLGGGSADVVVAGQQQQKVGDGGVERALSEFRNRDWSDCRKTQRDGLTCYECRDGLEVHSGCMFVSDSQSSLVFDDDGGGAEEVRNVAPVDFAGTNVARNENTSEFLQLKESSPWTYGVGEWTEGVQVPLPQRLRENVAEPSHVGLGEREASDQVKLNRKLVVKKRKLKQQPGCDYSDHQALPEKIDKDFEDAVIKRTIRRKVAVRRNGKKSEDFQN